MTEAYQRASKHGLKLFKIILRIKYINIWLQKHHFNSNTGQHENHKFNIEEVHVQVLQSWFYGSHPGQEMKS